MSIKRTITIFLASALVLAAIFGVAAFTKASAQSATPTAPSPSTAPDKEPGNPRFELRMDGSRNEDLANALGITTGELTAGFEKATSEALAQAVTNGLITQAQADELQSSGRAFPFGGRWGGWLNQNGIDFESLLADALGITAVDLRAAYVQAFNARIDQAVTDGKLTQEQADLMKGQHALTNSESFKSAIQTAFEAAVQQAVANGTITQSQADLILQNRANGMGFPGMGAGGGRHGFPGFGDGMKPNRGDRHGAPLQPADPATSPTGNTGG